MHSIDPAQLLTQPGEPNPATLRAPLARLLLATRLPFLTITLFGALLGIAGAWSDGVPLNVLGAIVTLLLALVTHAAVNVLNDWCDHHNGTDAINTDRIYPFTGGSRMIQNGVFSAIAMRNFAIALFAIAIVGGLVLTVQVGSGLLLFGIAGVVIGWAYSAAPLALNSRGAGEVCVAAAFWLVVAGADFVQRGEFSSMPLWIGGAYALLTTNVLYINQFPDRAADLAVGKRHWVARLQPSTARWGYALILLLALACVVVPVLLGLVPKMALLALIGFVPTIPATRTLLAHAATPARLAPAIQQTIAAAHLAALFMGIGLVLAAWNQ